MRPLRIAVLTQPGTNFEDWELRLFERIRSHPELDLVSVTTIDDAQHGPERNSLLGQMLAFERAALLRGQRTAPETTPIEAVRDDDALPDAEIFLSHIRGGWPSSDVYEQREVWGYSHLTDAGWKTFGAAEVANGHPVTRIGLLRRQQGIIEPLDVSITNTKLFGAFNVDYANDKLVAVVDRALRRRSRGSIGEKAGVGENVACGETNSFTYTTKTATRIVKRSLGSISRKVGGRPNDWTLLMGHGDILSHPMTGLIELPKPEKEFRADPFLFEHDSQTFVFFEAFPYRTRKGEIRVARLEGGRLADERTLNFGDIHLSYPFVFRDESSIFMIPETHQRNRVEVWRAIRFPDEWELYSTALAGRTPVDTTLFKHGGHWWLFTNLSSGAFEDQGQELHAFRVSGPELRDMRPHIDNPIVIDSTSARNGGRPFHRDGELYRPAQITSHGQYGHGIKVMRITELSLEAFSEEPELVITPVPGSGTTGCHHLDVSSEGFILDARRAFGNRLFGARPISLQSVRVKT